MEEKRTGAAGEDFVFFVPPPMIRRTAQEAELPPKWREYGRSLSPIGLGGDLCIHARFNSSI
jgi:hypothetical protein